MQNLDETKPKKENTVPVRATSSIAGKVAIPNIFKIRIHDGRWMKDSSLSCANVPVTGFN